MKPPYADTTEVRQAIIDACRALNARGINQGTSGNISVRVNKELLITPSGVDYDTMTPEMIVPVPITGRKRRTAWKPSTEVPFHRSILAAKPGMHAVVHAHPVHCTALAMLHREIPACHYMVAAFGGDTVPLAGYARFGSDALSRQVVTAMADRHGCLMANHGAVVVGETLERAMWRMEELETLARGYILSLSLGEPHILSTAQIDAVLKAFSGYGAGNVRE